MSTRKAASPGSTDLSIASGPATDVHRLPLALTVGGLLFALYAWTLSPSVAVGDSGELITAAATLGIPHPPGYPLWCLIHHLPARFAPGSAAAAVNVMTAGFAALAGVLAFGLAAGVLRLPRLTAAGVALLAGVSPSVWGQAVIAEIYALNLVIVLAFASLTLARRFGPLFAFTAGLALLSHGTNALLVLPALVWGYATRRDERGVRRPSRFCWDSRRSSTCRFVPPRDRPSTGGTRRSGRGSWTT